MFSIIAYTEENVGYNNRGSLVFVDLAAIAELSEMRAQYRAEIKSMTENCER